MRIFSFIIAAMMLATTGLAAAEENASNPLAAVNNVDLRWQYPWRYPQSIKVASDAIFASLNH